MGDNKGQVRLYKHPCIPRDVSIRNVAKIIHRLEYKINEKPGIVDNDISRACKIGVLTGALTE